MANRFPLVLNQANLQIQELASGDNLNLLNNDIVNVGNIVPQGNLTYDLGNATNYWNNLYLSGTTIFLGNLQLKEVNSTTFGVFESDGVTQADIDVGNIDVSAITQGTSVIGIDGVDGNAYITVDGTSNVVLAQSTGVSITGTLSATGNITGGNLITAGVVSASGNIEGNYFIGNGSQLDGIDTTLISNGTSEVKVISSGGNIRSNVAGSTVMITSSDGVEITGTLNSTANVTGGNLVTAGDVTTATVTASSNISGANLNVAGNITSGNLLVNTDAIITGNLTVQGTETIFNVETLTVNDKDIVVANNVTGGANVNGAGLLAGNPTVASFVYNNATSSWQVNVAVTPNANGTLALGGTDNRWGDAWVTSLTATGNVESGNVVTGGTVDATGNVSGGNLITSGEVIATGNITVGNLSTSGSVTAGSITGVDTIDAIGNIVGGNILSNDSIFAIGNITTANYYFGNGAFLDGIDTTLISNGTSSVRVVSSGGNITANVADQTVQLWHVDGVTITGNIDTSGQGRVRFFDSDSSNYVGFQAPATVASDLDFVLPDGYGNSGEFLTTDGTGSLSWSSASGFFNSTLLIFPGALGNADYGEGESYVGEVASVDSFQVPILPNYSCMDPSGSFAPTTDLGGLT